MTGNKPTFYERDVVLIAGLQTARGRTLNGTEGLIIGYDEATERYQVRIVENFAPRTVAMKRKLDRIRTTHPIARDCRGMGWLERQH